MSIDTLERTEKQENISSLDEAFDDSEIIHEYDPETGQHNYYTLADIEREKSPKFIAIMDEVKAEYKYMKAHPKEYKRYDSFKELLRDCGIDVSNIPDK